MRYLIRISLIALGLAVSNPAMAQTVCTQNGASIVCNNGLTGTRVGNAIIWNDGSSQRITPTAPRNIYGPSARPNGRPYNPANPSSGVPSEIYGR
jgi:hypothetical protein